MSKTVGLKGFIIQKLFNFKDRYYRCNCGSLICDDEIYEGQHRGHKCGHATWITLTELVWIHFKEFIKYRLKGGARG